MIPARRVVSCRVDGNKWDKFDTTTATKKWWQQCAVHDDNEDNKVATMQKLENTYLYGKVSYDESCSFCGRWKEEDQQYDSTVQYLKFEVVRVLMTDGETQMHCGRFMTF